MRGECQTSGTYELTEAGFLSDFRQWDEGFPRHIAGALGLTDGVTEDHWRVIRYIRARFGATGRCPLVYETCRANGLRLHDLKRLFPTGYMRGACKAAGLTYLDSDLPTVLLRHAVSGSPAGPEKGYRVDGRGFLLDPSEWDESFAVRLAEDLKMPHGLREPHWNVIRFLRSAHLRTGAVPLVYDACESLGLSLEDLADLFPDGYHRGAVRMAGLRNL